MPFYTNPRPTGPEPSSSGGSSDGSGTRVTCTPSESITEHGAYRKECETHGRISMRDINDGEGQIDMNKELFGEQTETRFR